MHQIAIACTTPLNVCMVHDAVPCSHSIVYGNIRWQLACRVRPPGTPQPSLSCQQGPASAPTLDFSMPPLRLERRALLLDNAFTCMAKQQVHAQAHVLCVYAL